MIGLPRRRWVRRTLLALLAAIVVIAMALAVIGYRIMWMPGWSYAEVLPAMTPEQVALRDRLRKHVEMLATELGERNADHIDAYVDAQKYIASTFREAGYEPEEVAGTTIGGQAIANVVAEIRGGGGADAKQIVI